MPSFSVMAVPRACSTGPGNLSLARRITRKGTETWASGSWGARSGPDQARRRERLAAACLSPVLATWILVRCDGLCFRVRLCWLLAWVRWRWNRALLQGRRAVEAGNDGLHRSASQTDPGTQRKAGKLQINRPQRSVGRELIAATQDRQQGASRGRSRKRESTGSGPSKTGR